MIKDLSIAFAAFMTLIPAGQSETIRIPMKACRLTRPARIDIKIDKKGNPSINQKPDFQLVWKGSVTVDRESFDIYLPRAGSYSLKNTAKDDGDLYNTSTLISIDSNHDGRLTEDEGWFANLPIRIGDKMFEAVQIAPNGNSVELKPSAKPLSGIVVGRKIPPFAYKSRDGKSVTQDTYKGKAVLLDVWSVT